MPSDRILIQSSGVRGPKGDKGDTGSPGPAAGLPSGGTTGEVLGKNSNADGDVGWIPQTGGTGDVAGSTHAATSKTTLVDADEVPVADSSASYGLKKALLSNLWAYIQTKMNAAGVAKLSTARTINGVSFDGTANIAPRLDQVAAPTADVSMNSHKLTNVTDPASAQDAATKNYADTALAKKPTFIIWDGTGSQPARPVTPTGVPVIWISPATSITGGGTEGGGTGAVNGLDIQLRTVS